MRGNLFPIAKEGWSYILGAFGVFVLSFLLDFDFLEFLSFFALLFFVFVFRNPEREHLLYQEQSVVAPIDGVVSSIQEIGEDTNDGYKIVVETGYAHVALLRAPFNATIEDAALLKGARLSRLSPLSEELGERAEFTLSDPKSSNKMRIVHRLKQSFAPLSISVSTNQTIMQGARYGVMVNGTTTLYLPKNFRCNINVGSELVASETLVGYFTEK